METTGLDRMLSQLRTAQALASRKPQAPAAAAEAGPKEGDFANVLKSSLGEVARLQNGGEPKAVHRGRPDHNRQP